MSVFFCVEIKTIGSALTVRLISETRLNKKHMFTNISWTDYFITVTILLAIYYLFVAIRYYAGDIKDLLSGKRKLNLKTAISYNSKGEYPLTIERNTHPSEASFEETTDKNFTEVEHLIERLKGLIADASHRKMIPQEFK